MTASTRFRVSSDTSSTPRTTLDTVDFETPASCATSKIVMLRPTRTVYGGILGSVRVAMSDDFEPVRLGIAGTGFISGVHAECAVRSPSVELVAVASARGRASRERVGPLDPAVELLTLDELFATRRGRGDHGVHADERPRRARRSGARGE